MSTLFKERQRSHFEANDARRHREDVGRRVQGAVVTTRWTLDAAPTRHLLKGNRLIVHDCSLHTGMRAFFRRVVTHLLTAPALVVPGRMRPSKAATFESAPLFARKNGIRHNRLQQPHLGVLVVALVLTMPVFATFGAAMCNGQVCMRMATASDFATPGGGHRINAQTDAEIDCSTTSHVIVQWNWYNRIWKNLPTTLRRAKYPATSS